MDKLTEGVICEMGAGPELDALCATAVGFKWENKIHGCCIARGNNSPDPDRLWSPSCCWSEAGDLLIWLRGKPFKPVGLEYDNLERNWLVTRSSFFYADANSPCLAIARAVAIAGLRARPKKMQKAWKALKEER